MDLIVETEAYKHTRGCASCRRGTPCIEATERFYGGGLFEMPDPDQMVPSRQVASKKA
jgi:hypothetical protein